MPNEWDDNRRPAAGGMLYGRKIPSWFVRPELPDDYHGSDEDYLHERVAFDMSNQWLSAVTRECLAVNQQEEQAAAEDLQGFDDVTEGWDDPPVEPSLLFRSDGRACAYEGQIGIIGGASESGKTRLTDMLTMQEFAGGRPVGRWDLENGVRLSRQALRDMGMTLDQAKELLRYRHAAGIWSPEKAGKEAKRLRDAGGRLMVMDSSTAIAHALGLEVSGGKTADVQELYTRALRPWVDAGLCALIIDNTAKGNPLDPSGNQHKRSGVDFGLAVVLTEPHGIGQRGSSQVWKIKDRASGIPFVLREISGRQERFVGDLVSEPEPQRGPRGVQFTLAAPEAAAAFAAIERNIAQDREEARVLLELLPVVGQGEGMSKNRLVKELNERGVKMGNSSPKYDRLMKLAGPEIVVREPSARGARDGGIWRRGHGE